MAKFIRIGYKLINVDSISIIKSGCSQGNKYIDIYTDGNSKAEPSIRIWDRDVIGGNEEIENMFDRICQKLDVEVLNGK